jgi:hypothetical protein
VRATAPERVALEIGWRFEGSAVPAAARTLLDDPHLYVVRPEGLESLEAFLAELWPAGLQRLKAAVESGDGG